MEKLCSLIRLSVLTQTTGAASSTLIVATYLIVLNLFSVPYDMFTLLKYFIVLVAFGTQLATFTYFLDRMNNKKDNVNFGLYSCNWTAMDIGFKKTLLLAMGINNSNRLAIKATPAIIINLECFLKVLRVSYTILSVMINTRHTSSG
ncbi:uncharacterized protein LOC126846998 [Adelges cooleyi]|uniref:uncharacterized protein LOC126846998 n=1 Tax=Adelges cooleyi TaxID=133065 RepID=UPI0021808BD2|nr:uncharacterized protein LOC126846998 [Adelges cooleyi]